MPTLDSPPSNLNFQEWLLAEDVVALLRPFEKLTVILSGEKYVSLSSVIPLIFGLQNAINTKTPETSHGKFLQRSLANEVEKRLGVYETNRTAAKATFLDPRLKKKAFGSELNANNAQMSIINELKDYMSIENSNQVVESITTESIYVEDEIWGAIDKKILQNNTQLNPYSTAALTIKQYIELPYLDRKMDPLLFWEEKKQLFPALYKLALKYLCIPATSVPSERLFSKAGMLCNARRNRLVPKKLNQILFLNSTI